MTGDVEFDTITGQPPRNVFNWGRCWHVWMPPKPGGLKALARLLNKSLRLPNGDLWHFTALEAERMPEHCWSIRWCLLCYEPHHEDLRALAMQP